MASHKPLTSIVDCHACAAPQLEFLTQRLLIPQGLSLTLKDLALGRARKTSGQGLPFFVGALIMRNETAASLKAMRCVCLLLSPIVAGGLRLGTVCSRLMPGSDGCLCSFDSRCCFHYLLQRHMHTKCLLLRCCCSMYRARRAVIAGAGQCHSHPHCMCSQ